MYRPEKDEFLKLAETHNLIPVYREIMADDLSPVSAYQTLALGKYSFLLESAEGGERLGRYSFLGGEARTVVSSGRGSGDPLRKVKEVMSQFNPAKTEGLPSFYGGAVGYLSYDIVRHFENVPGTSDDDLDLPEMVFMLTDTILIFDHLKHRVKIVANAHVNGAAASSYDQAVTKIESIIKRLSTNGSMLKRLSVPTSSEAPSSLRSNMTESQFKEAVEKAKEYIRAGDILQVVLSQRFSTTLSTGSFDVYRALRSVNPAPYMYYLKLDGFELVGSSPEPLVKVQGDTVLTCPIAGTRPRGDDEAQDEKMRSELLSDEKEKAEHIMLVDLGRNDLGRVCVSGSVKVDELMYIENYSHVMHIVSTVTGKLKPGRDAFDALRSCFPAGTVSGAPKIRAMEIIDELEPTRRGPYAGVVGYFGYSGDLDTCITIRTILCKGDKAYVQAGAGIVYDSVPEREFAETGHKAQALLSALSMAEGS